MKATMIVFQGKGKYMDDHAVEDVIGYAADSTFAAFDEIVVSDNVNNNYIDLIIKDFLAVQNGINMMGHKRLFHFLLTATFSKRRYPILSNAAMCVVDYFQQLGFQCIAVPHYGSEKDHSNFHYHVIVNAVSFRNGSRFYGRNEDFRALADCLEVHTRTNWNVTFKQIKQPQIYCQDI